MDPNANLAELRRLVARFMQAWDEADEETGAVTIDTDDALRMAELVEALDGWLSKGGFLPAAWSR
jgi:hypothetical protein